MAEYNAMLLAAVKAQQATIEKNREEIEQLKKIAFALHERFELLDADTRESSTRAVREGDSNAK
ncbi:MAG: hypothetical protein ACE5EQ_07125 [Phycisphaerae bacterium]